MRSFIHSSFYVIRTIYWNNNLSYPQEIEREKEYRIIIKTKFDFREGEKESIGLLVPTTTPSSVQGSKSTLEYSIDTPFKYSFRRDPGLQCHEPYEYPLLIPDKTFSFLVLP